MFRGPLPESPSERQRRPSNGCKRPGGSVPGPVTRLCQGPRPSLQSAMAPLVPRGPTVLPPGSLQRDGDVATLAEPWACWPCGCWRVCCRDQEGTRVRSTLWAPWPPHQGALRSPLLPRARGWGLAVLLTFDLERFPSPPTRGFFWAGWGRRPDRHSRDRGSAGAGSSHPLHRWENGGPVRPGLTREPGRGWAGAAPGVRPGTPSAVRPPSRPRAWSSRLAGLPPRVSGQWLRGPAAPVVRKPGLQPRLRAEKPPGLKLSFPKRTRSRESPRCGFTGASPGSRTAPGSWPVRGGPGEGSEPCGGGPWQTSRRSWQAQLASGVIFHVQQ